jgi:DNA gyrase inhibitor GyrI
MRRWLLLVFLALTITVITAYAYISFNHEFAFASVANCTQSAAARLIVSKDNWKHWWPGEQANDSIYRYKELNYKIDKILLYGFEATIFRNKDSAKGFLTVVPTGNDSARFEFAGKCVYSSNPVTRVLQYFRFGAIRDNIENFVSETRTYFNKQQNIYGFNVVEGKVRDSSMISTKETFNHYPDVKEVYEIIDRLRQFVKEKGGEQVDSPMLNVYADNPGRYQVMVAIPTKSDLPSESGFQLKKMVLGNILIAEVKGGPATVRLGEENLQNYVDDYHKVSPAIPYQSLVTNRMVEKDTTKWITRLYYPVFR